MISRRRVATYVLAVTAAAGLLAAPSAAAVSRHPAKSAARAGVIGHLAYVSKNQRVMVVAVQATGHTSRPTRIGPITPVSSKQSVQVFGLVASSNGHWVAWQEDVMQRKAGQVQTVKEVLVIANLKQGQVFHLRTDAFPIGFATNQLVTSLGRPERLVLTPTPHLVEVPGGESPQTAYPHGVVDTVPLKGPTKSSLTIRLRLTNFDGAQTVLHNYVLKANDNRFPDQSYVSGDGKELALERGDHTDFGGVGPSSVVDEYSLSNGARTALGHYGTAKAAWRIASISFAWPDDEPWAVWERATKSGAESLVAAYQHGQWKEILDHGLAVAGNHDGYVVAQAGKYVQAPVDEPVFNHVPEGNALLIRGKVTKVLGVRGSAFAWVV